MFEVATRKRILSAKKGTPDTADVYNLNLIGINRGLTSFAGHGYKLPGKFGLVVKANLPLCRGVRPSCPSELSDQLYTRGRCCIACPRSILRPRSILL